MFANFITNLIAKRLAKLLILAAINALGFASVAGIPIVLIIDALFIFMALQEFYLKAAPLARQGFDIAYPVAKKACKILLWSLAGLLLAGTFFSFFS